jgi:hypothetical protein
MCSIYMIVEYCLRNDFGSRTVTNRTRWIFTNEAHHLRQGRPWLVAGSMSFIVPKNTANSVRRSPPQGENSAVAIPAGLFRFYDAELQVLENLFTGDHGQDLSWKILALSGAPPRSDRLSNLNHHAFAQHLSPRPGGHDTGATFPRDRVAAGHRRAPTVD